MIIANDTFTIEPTDTAQLSPAMQKALRQYLGTNVDDQGNFVVSIEDFLSTRLNEHLEQAMRVFSKPQLDALQPLADALAKADDKTKADAQVLLDQAAVTVGITIKPVPIQVEPPIEVEPAALTKP